MRIDSFQFVSRIAALDIAGTTISAEARVPQDHSIFGGHFPGHALMPGVLLTELMAQTCGFLLLSLNGFSKMPFLASLKEVKLRDFVVPGTELTCAATLAHDGSGYAVLNSRIQKIGAKKNRVCDGTLMFRVVPFPNAELRQHMHIRAREVGLSVAAERVCLSQEAAQ